MKKLLISALALFVVGSVAAQEGLGETYNKAVAAYNSKDFASAATAFETLIDQGLDSEDLDVQSWVATAKKSVPVCYFQMGLTDAKGNDFNTAVENLTKLLKAKGRLIRKALAVDKLPIEVTDSTVKFPWFAECSTDECKAYTHFISALCELAANAKRVTAKEKETDNDKYAFRCFLLRLGFIGSEYKAERKILLRNLTGSSAFRNGGAVNEVSE